MTACVANNEHKLMENQLGVYTTIILSIESERGSLLFLNAPGGTGKTFTINLLLAKLLKMKYNVTTVTSSGITATLLCGGHSAHSCYKLPLDLSKKKTSYNISRGSIKGECRFIICNEMTMDHKVSFEAPNMALQDLRHNTRLMKGTTVLLTGNFRQTLPVVP